MACVVTEKEELVLDSGVGSSVASSDSTSDEHLQTSSTNATRIIHVHHNLNRRLSSPVQQFRREQTIEIDYNPITMKTVKPENTNGESSTTKKCQSWLLRLFDRRPDGRQSHF